MTSRFLVCDWCGVAFDVGAKECNSRWCTKPEVVLHEESVVIDSEVINYVSVSVEPKQKRKYQQKKQDPIVSRWMGIVSRSKRRGYEYNVSVEDIRELVNSPCVYCLSTERIEVDRKDSSLGYLKDNIAPACHRCNTVKNNVVTYEEMMFIADFLGWRINNALRDDINGQQL